MLRATAQKALRRAESLRNSGVFSPKQQKRSMSGGGSIEEEIGTKFTFFFYLSLPFFFHFLSLRARNDRKEKRSLSLSLTQSADLSRVYSLILITKTAEMNKWRTVTFLAIPACCAFGVYSFANAEHGHGEEQPAYSYLKRRSREQWPWGGDLGLFEYPKEDGGHH